MDQSKYLKVQSVTYYFLIAYNGIWILQLEFAAVDDY